MSMFINILTLLMLSLTAPLAKAEKSSSEPTSNLPYPERVFSSLPQEEKESCSNSMKQWKENALNHSRIVAQEGAKRDVFFVLGALQTAVCVAELYSPSQIANHIVGTIPILISAGYCFFLASVCELNRQSADTGKIASQAEYEKDKANYLHLLNESNESSESSELNELNELNETKRKTPTVY